MTRMTAAQAAVLVMEREGVTSAFGVPGAAINPLYAALRSRNSIKHFLARHVEGASHMAEGCTRANAGNIGVCIGTSGPAGTDMITACTPLRPTRSRSFASPAKRRGLGCTRRTSRPSTSSGSPSRHQMGRHVREPALVPRVFQQAFHLMRSGRPGPVLIDLPFDVQMGEIAFDIETYGRSPSTSRARPALRWRRR